MDRQLRKRIERLEQEQDFTERVIMDFYPGVGWRGNVVTIVMPIDIEEPEPIDIRDLE